MKTPKKIISALRGERDSILKRWQADVQRALWQHDVSLTARRGAAFEAARATLDLITQLYQERQDSLNRDGVVPLPETAEINTSDSAEETTHTFDDLFHRVSILRHPTPSSVHECARQWCVLEIPWRDIRTMLGFLDGNLLHALTTRGIAKEEILVILGFLDTMMISLVDQRMDLMESKLSAQSDRVIETQHLAERFMGNASHELRTPLTAILGFAELLLEGNYGDLISDQEMVVKHIENSAQNLSEIVGVFLDVMKIRGNTLEPRFQLAALAPQLDSLYRILQPLAIRKKVEFSLDIDKEVGSIETDETFLRHAIYRLVSITLRATPEEGCVVLSAKKTGSSITITTYDTALHLPPEAIKMMSHSYAREENSPVRGYDNWEIGIPLVRRYIEMLEGRMEIESSPDTGTYFRITLPRLRKKQRGEDGP